MNILICEEEDDKNLYIKLLADAYKRAGCNVIYGVHNFYYSNFIPDVLHIQWPEALYLWESNVRKTDQLKKNFKKRLKYFSENGSTLVYTVHNLFPHTSNEEKDYQYFSLISEYADCIVHHGQSSIPLVKEKYPATKDASHVVCPHGAYPFIESSLTFKEAREKYFLSHDKFVYLNFGSQRDQKGGNFLRSVFSNEEFKESILFTIGRNPLNYDRQNFIKQRLKKYSQKLNNYYLDFTTRFFKKERLIYRSVPNKEVPDVVKASDVFILGHQKGLNSGVIALAMTYGKPLVLPDIGNFKDQSKGWEWREFYKVGSLNSAIDAIKRMNHRIDEYTPGELVFDNSEWLQQNTWDRHVEVILHEVSDNSDSEYSRIKS